MTASVFAVGVRGTTSPRPSVKNVVPLMYMSAPNPGPAPVMVSAEPAAHGSMKKLAGLGELGCVNVAVAEHSPRRRHVHSADQVDHSVATHHRGGGCEAAPRLRVREHRRLRSFPSIG